MRGECVRMCVSKNAFHIFNIKFIEQDMICFLFSPGLSNTQEFFDISRTQKTFYILQVFKFHRFNPGSYETFPQLRD